MICSLRAATKQEIASSGVTVAALFFKKVFGIQAERALSVFVALRSISFQYCISVLNRSVFSALG